MDPKAHGLARTLADMLDAGMERLTIDGDTHITDLAAMSEARRSKLSSSPDYYHGRPISAEQLVAEMDLAQVDAAISWQNPAATEYGHDPDENAERLLRANRYVFESAVRHAGRILPGGWTDPRSCGVLHAVRIAETCIREFGFPLVKMNPAQNRFPIDGPEVTQVVDRIVELGAIPVFHFGGDSPYTPASGLEAIAARHSGHPVLAIHMGGGGSGYVEGEKLYHEARLLGLRRPNIRYVLSARRDTHTENDLITYQIAGAPFSQNLICASDAPYGRMSWNFGGYRAMFDTLMDPRHPDPRLRAHPGLFTPQAVRGYLGANCARLIVEAIRRVHPQPEPVAAALCP